MARIVLARPAQANAVDLPTAHAFAAAVDRAADPDVRAVLVRGEGRRFCAGDVTAMATAPVIVSAASTKFLLAYADVGLAPDCGVSYLLPRAIGQQRALGLALTGRTLTAEDG
ncbi:enoyl-CoA hydratase/isomerase family protein [Streptomyces sp. DASNCL29]|uniref:enoyl-CoA hydratase/isomerase family protein n=1 Tax=Streptomyces sp. DASNCL29 TaxID=2583819 RepID=UPI001F0D9D35|nr:enoyl-CoA hydratase/isomerase family protein [Streptomyces sp. DASNCL29]